MKRILKMIGKGILILLGIIFLALLGMTIYNTIVTMQERKSLAAVGQDISVGGQNMRIDIQGAGEHTIVLLSGLGTYSPIEDFRPLATGLSEKNRVVTIEYFGYGLSDDTKEARTNDNIVAEIRDALGQAGIEPPYILAAHSLSGVYALDYIRKYPNEVEALVGIDPSVPNQVDYESGMPIAEWLYYPSRAFDIIGLSRMELREDAMLQEMADSGSYSAEALNRIKAVKAKRSASMALIHENNTISENLTELKGVKYPDSLPVLTFLADDTMNQSDEMFAEKGYDITWEKLHEDLITNSSIQKIEILTGTHYLHWTNSEKMASEITEFIEQAVDSKL